MRRLLLVLIFFLSAPAWADPTLSLTGTARLGGVLFLRVTDVPPGATGVAVWAGREWPLSAADAGGAMRTLLPVPTGSRAGRQQLEVRLSTGTRLRRTVPVSQRHFPLQHISLDPATLAGYDDPRNKADDERIRHTPADAHAEAASPVRLPGQPRPAELPGDRAAAYARGLACAARHGQVARRDSKSLSSKLRRGGVRTDKTLKNFDFGANPSLNRHQIFDLASCRFIDEHHNVLMCGPTGVGKRPSRHGDRARGMSARVRRALRHHDPHLDSLRAARAARGDAAYALRIANLLRVDRLTLDDFGLKPLRLRTRTSMAWSPSVPSGARSCLRAPWISLSGDRSSRTGPRDARR